MCDKFESFFSHAGKHIIALERIACIKLDHEKSNELGYAIVGILEEGYELSRQDHQSVTDLLDNQLYRKGRICEIDGIEFYHQSTKYVKVLEDGHEFDFNLTNLPDFCDLEKFHNSVNSFICDSDVRKAIEHNKSLAESSHVLAQYAEVIYWRKVADSIYKYHKANKRDYQAREVLAKAGFSDDEIEGYIPSPQLNE